MDAPLYDRELDGIPPGFGATAGDGQVPDTAGKSALGGRAPGTFAGWFEGLGLPELIGWSVSLGALIATPLAVATRHRPVVIAFLAGFFLVTPLAALWRIFRRAGDPGGGVAKARTAPARAPVMPSASVPARAKVPAGAVSRIRIRDEPDGELRIEITGRPFVDQFMLPPFAFGLLICFGVSGTMLVEGLRGKILDFHPLYPLMVGPALIGATILAGNVLQMFVNETLLIDGEALFLAHDLFGFRGAKRFDLRHVGDLSYHSVDRRVVVPWFSGYWRNDRFGLRLTPEEAGRILNSVAARRLQPSPRRNPAGIKVRHVDPMRGLGPTSRRLRVVDEGGGCRVSLAARGPQLESLMIALMGLAPIVVSLGVSYALKSGGVRTSRDIEQILLALMGLCYVVSFFGYLVLRAKVCLWITARTDGDVLELTQEYGPGLGERFRALSLFMARPLISWGRKDSTRGRGRTFQVRNLASLDTHRSDRGTENHYVACFDFHIVESDRFVFDLAAWLLPGSKTPEQVILFAQHLRDILDVPGEDFEPIPQRPSP